MKRFFILALALLCLTLCACSKADIETTAKDTSASQADTTATTKATTAATEATTATTKATEAEPAEEKEPITASFYDESLLKGKTYTEHIIDDSEFTEKIIFTAPDAISDIVFSIVDYSGDTVTEEELYTLDSLNANTPLVMGVVFYGDMTTYTIAFRDSAGSAYHKAISISGKDGSLLLTPYDELF